MKQTCFLFDSHSKIGSNKIMEKFNMNKNITFYNKKSRWSIGGIIGVLILTQILMSVNFFYDLLDSSTSPHIEIRSSETHDVIELYSEWYLEEFPDKTGSGTAGDPFIIQDFEIDAGGAQHCILLYNSDYYVTFRNCTLTNAASSAIFIYNCRNVEIDNCTITSNNDGIYVISSPNLHITSNSITYNGGSAINIFHSNYSVLEYNSVMYNDYFGYIIYNSHHLQFRYNGAHNNYLGVFFQNCSYNTINNNNIVSNDQDGLSFSQGSNYNTITDNNVAGNGWDYGDPNIGFRSESNYNTISGNTISSGGDGILISSSHHNIATGNFISGVRYEGIYLTDNSSCNRIIENDVDSCSDGALYLHYAYDNIITGNNFTDSGDDGVSLVASKGNLIAGNNISLIDGNWDVGAIYLSYYDTGSDIYNSTDNDIILNLISNSENAVVYYTGSENNIVEENYIWGITDSFFYENGGVGWSNDTFPNNNFTSPGPLWDSYDPDNDGLSDGEEFSLGTHPRNNDTDSDGLLDGEEVSLGTTPYKNDTDGDGLLDGFEVFLGTNPLLWDTDGDTISDGVELDIGTDPLLADTDDDGLSDGEEVYTYLTDPNDSDSDDDGLLDGEEVNTYSTDPHNVDSDDDGLLDGEEVNTYSTDPNLADSDNDGMPDGWEISYDLDPNYDLDGSGDLDGDGLTNLEEYNGQTDPSNSDSDNDGLSDGEEVNTYNTDPNDEDSDGDSLSDGEEVNTYNTDPNDRDTDGDSYDDDEEIEAGTDPLDPDSYPDSETFIGWSPSVLFGCMLLGISILIFKKRKLT